MPGLLVLGLAASVAAGEGAGPMAEVSRRGREEGRAVGYAGIAESYLRDGPGTVRTVAGWHPAAIQSAAEEWLSARRLEGGAPDAAEERLLRAAALLHAELASHATSYPQVSAFHAETAEAFAAAASPPPEWARRWQLVVAALALSRWDTETAEEALEKERGSGPDTPDLLTSLGAMSEIRAWLEVRRSAYSPVASGAVEARRSDQLVRSMWQRALRSYDEALEVCEACTGARLRAARVRQLLGRDAEAIPELERVVESPHPWQRYLAQLFLGRAREHEGDLSGAVARYRAAVAELPDAPTAHIALSHALLARGSPEGGRALDAALSVPEAGRNEDPWHEYPFPPVAETRERIAALRRELIP